MVKNHFAGLDTFRWSRATLPNLSTASFQRRKDKRELAKLAQRFQTRNDLREYLVSCLMLHPNHAPRDLNRPDDDTLAFHKARLDRIASLDDVIAQDVVVLQSLPLRPLLMMDGSRPPKLVQNPARYGVSLESVAALVSRITYDAIDLTASPIWKRKHTTLNAYHALLNAETLTPVYNLNLENHYELC